MRIRAGLLAITMLAPAGLALAPGAQAATPTRTQAAAARSVSSGTFRKAVYVKNVVGRGVALPSAVAIADVTGDGRPDLIVSTVDPDNVHGGTTIAVYRQRDNGTLAAPVATKAPPPDYNDYNPDITVADLYRNGQKEILVPEYTYVDVFVYRRGRLTGPTRLPVDAVDLTVADMNRDGHPDLLTSTNVGGKTHIYLGSAAHKFKLSRTLSFQQNADFLPLLSAADFNHDGRMDIVHRNGDSFSVSLQDSRGRFSTGKAYTPAPIGGVLFGVADLAVGDVTGDGRPDVITDTLANSPNSGVEVFAGTGSGTFKAPVVYPTLDIPMGMALADLNGDGRKDLVINHDGWSAVGVMLQTSKGTFAPETTYPVENTDGGTPAVGDLNGDGKPDIAVTDGSDGIAILYAK